jgi:YD repeat-containing protein
MWRKGGLIALALIVAGLSVDVALSDQKCHSYDPQGRLVQSTRPGAKREQWSYDKADNRMTRAGSTWSGVCAPPIAYRVLVGLGIGGAVPAKLEVTNPSFQVAVNETRGVYAADLGSASDGGDISVSNASTNCGAVSVMPGGASLSYLAPASPQTCAVNYTVQHAFAGSKSGTATVTIVTSPTTVTASNPTRTVPLLSTLALAAAQLGSTSDAQPVRVVNASPSCGSATLANGGAHLNYTAPATTGSCTVGYRIQHPTGAAGNGTATFTVQAAALNPSRIYTGSGGSVFSVSDLANMANNEATIQSMTPAGCGTANIASDGQSVAYAAPNNIGQPGEGVPPPINCSVPYSIRWSANGNTFPGAVSVTVNGEKAKGGCPPTGCP